MNINNVCDVILMSKTVSMARRFTETRILHDEVLLYSRLLSRNENQHRRSMFFKKLVQVRRQLNCFSAINLPDAFHVLSSHCPDPKKLARMSSSTTSSPSPLPSSSMLQSTLLRAAGAAGLATDCRALIVSLSRILFEMLSRGEFMAFTMSVIACLARMYILIGSFIMDVVHIYKVLLPWVDVLPNISIEDNITLNNNDLPSCLHTALQHRHVMMDNTAAIEKKLEAAATTTTVVAASALMVDVATSSKASGLHVQDEEDIGETLCYDDMELRGSSNRKSNSEAAVTKGLQTCNEKSATTSATKELQTCQSSTKRNRSSSPKQQQQHKMIMKKKKTANSKPMEELDDIDMIFGNF